jgi:hypothetical protein
MLSRAPFRNPSEKRMLKRTAQTVRAVAESAGIIAPSTADANQAAEQHRQALIGAQAALENADQALQAAHDRGADNAEVTRLEAALAAAKVEVSRAEGRYLGAERRLKGAQAVDADKATAAALVKRDESLAIRAKAAAEIDRLAAELAEQCRVFDSQLDALREAARAGVATQVMRATAHSLVMHSLERAGALRSTWIGNRADQPGAVELAARDAGTVVTGIA